MSLRPCGEKKKKKRKSIAIPLAICRTLIAFHNFLQAYIHNGVLSVQFCVESSVLAHENCLWRDSRRKVIMYDANFHRKMPDIVHSGACMSVHTTLRRLYIFLDSASLLLLVLIMPCSLCTECCGWCLFARTQPELMASFPAAQLSVEWITRSLKM